MTESSMTDSIESHIKATPQQCEQVMASLRQHSGYSVSNLAFFSGLSRIIVIDALEQMERRGVARHDGPRWYEVRP